MSGFEPFLFGAAASGSAAATSGLIGTAGSFAFAPALSTALSVGGTLSSMGAANAQGEAAASAAEFNARAAQQEASSKQSLIRQESMRRMGTIRANIGKSGAALAGTPLLALSESAANAEIDALNAQYTGQRQAALYGASAANSRSQARTMAGASLLSGASRLF